eukprot:430789-Hanusia_phi.AAC.3
MMNLCPGARELGVSRDTREDMAAPLDGAGVEDIDLCRSSLLVEQKRIFLNLRENARGRYLRIAEVTGSNRSTIIIPSSGLMQLRSLLDEFIEYTYLLVWPGK